MSARSCEHEADVLDLVAIGQWPQRADTGLRAHASGCEVCAEVASIAIAVREWSQAAPVARMPEASVVWHRAQVRARADAARAAARPVWVAQAGALVALVVALAWMGPSASWYADVWRSVTQAMPSAPTGLSQMAWPESVTGGGVMTGWGASVFLAVVGLAALASLALGALKISERSEISNNQ